MDWPTKTTKKNKPLLVTADVCDGGGVAAAVVAAAEEGTGFSSSPLESISNSNLKERSSGLSSDPTAVVLFMVNSLEDWVR